MSTWHAYANRPLLQPGTEVLITGGHDQVRLRTADQITIEMPDHSRVTAVVVDRSDEQLLVAIGDGPLVSLRVSGDAGAFNDFKLSNGFSREGWAVH